MLNGPHPCESPVLLRPDGDVIQLRNLFCDHYDACLDVAVGAGWVSWKCDHCALFTLRTAAVTRAGKACAAAALVAH